MKIQKIHVHNFKAVEEQKINLNGCSAIITAGNDKGKTSILRGLVDRFNSEKPEVIVKEGQKNGFNIIDLTDGSRIEWKFTKKSESFAYITKDGVKQTTGVISAIGDKYFGKKFDIDSFLNSSPSAQAKELQRIVGLDFDKIDSRYKEAYDERTEANRELKRISSQKVEKPEEVKKPDIDSIKKNLSDAKTQNEKHFGAKSKHEKLNAIIEDVSSLIDETEFEELFDYDKAKKIVSDINIPEKVDVSDIENELEQAYNDLRKHDSYQSELNRYNEWIEEGKKARKEAEKADEKVKAIQDEKQAMIESAEMPDGFDIVDGEIIYNGFPLSNNQTSSSSKYIAALKLGYMLLGEVKTLHFDASFLDKNSLKKVQDWATDKGLQLLIERPDFDGGEIKYEIISNEEEK